MILAPASVFVVARRIVIVFSIRLRSPRRRPFSSPPRAVVLLASNAAQYATLHPGLDAAMSNSRRSSSGVSAGSTFTLRQRAEVISDPGPKPSPFENHPKHFGFEIHRSCTDVCHTFCMIGANHISHHPEYTLAPSPSRATLYYKVLSVIRSTWPNKI